MHITTIKMNKEFVKTDKIGPILASSPSHIQKWANFLRWKFSWVAQIAFALVSDTAAKDIFPKCVTNSQTHVSHTPQNITAQQHGIGFGDGNFSHIVIISNPNLSRVLLLGDRRKVSGSLQKTNLSHEGSIFLRRKKSDAKQQTRLFLFFTQTLQELRMLSSVTLNCQVTKIVWIQVLNCPNCNQCLKYKFSRIFFAIIKMLNCLNFQKTN